jgi:hypothetical protein
MRKKLKAPGHLIDCNAHPFVPPEWFVEKHQLGGLWEFNPTKVFFYPSNRQVTGSIEGHKLRQKLTDKSVLNANVLDYLLDHPELIPEDWKNKRIYFWGTIYRDSDGDLYVRQLDWDGSKWSWHFKWLNNIFSIGSFAAIAS